MASAARLWGERETDDSEPDDSKPDDSKPDDSDSDDSDSDESEPDEDVSSEGYQPEQPAKRRKKKLSKEELASREQRRKEREEAQEQRRKEREEAQEQRRKEREKTCAIKKEVREKQLSEQHSKYEKLFGWIGETPPTDLDDGTKWFSVHEFVPLELDMEVELPKPPAMSKALAKRVGSSEDFGKMVRLYGAISRSAETLESDLQMITKWRDTTAKQLEHYSRVMETLNPFINPVINMPPPAAQMRLGEVKHIWADLITIIPVLVARALKQAMPTITSNVHRQTARLRASRRFAEYDPSAPEFVEFGPCEAVAVVRHTFTSSTVIYTHLKDGTVVRWSKGEVVYDDTDTDDEDEDDAEAEENDEDAVEAEENDEDAVEEVVEVGRGRRPLYASQVIADNVETMVSLPTGEVVFSRKDDDRLELLGQFTMDTKPRLWCPIVRGIIYADGNAIMYRDSDGVHEYQGARDGATLTHLVSTSDGNTRAYGLFASYDLADKHASLLHMTLVTRKSGDEINSVDLELDNEIIIKIVPIPTKGQTLRVIVQARSAYHINSYLYSPKHKELIPLSVPYYMRRYFGERNEQMTATDFETGMITLRERVPNDESLSLVQTMIYIDENVHATEYRPVSKNKRRARMERVRVLHYQTNYVGLTTSPSGSQYAIRQDTVDDDDDDDDSEIITVSTLVRI